MNHLSIIEHHSEVTPAIHVQGNDIFVEAQAEDMYVAPSTPWLTSWAGRW